MPPLRLSSLSPDAVGVDAATRVLRRLSRLAVPLSPGVALSLGAGDAASTGVALTVADLCRYAQTGDVGDWGSPAGAEDALLEVGEALWSRPIDAGPCDGWTVDDLRAALADDADPSDPVRLAVGCAVARWAVARGERITSGELAALASVSASYVRGLPAATLATTRHPRGRTRVTYVAADEARRWLASRGAAGWRARLMTRQRNSDPSNSSLNAS